MSLANSRPVGSTDDHVRPHAKSLNGDLSISSTTLVQDDSFKDMKLQLQQLLLSTDFVIQSKVSGVGAGRRRVVGTPSDDYLEQLAPIIRDSMKKGNTSELVDTLEGLQRLKDREINQICSGDHNEYMASVEQLSEVARDANSMKEKVAMIANNVSQSGVKLALAKKKYLKTQQCHGNISSAIEAVEACLLVLELTNNVHQLLKEKRKFAALKSLDDLRNIHLKEVSDFGFAQLVERSLPALTKMVRTKTISDTDQWLSELSSKSPTIGKDIFERVLQQKHEWKKYTQSAPHYRKYKFNSPAELSFRESHVNYLTSDAIEMDFSILYESVLVHSSLGLLPQFQRHFETDRKIQRDYLVPNSLSPFSADNAEQSLDEVANIFHAVAGFCIIDRIISRRLPTLRLSREVDDIWESLSNKIDTILTSHITKIRDPELLRGYKRLLGTLLNAMQTFGFDTSKVEEIILKLFKWYSKMLADDFEKLFLQNLQRDDYMPMVVESPEIYDEICRVAWYKPDPNDRKRPFPKPVPFSEIYPFCCTEVRTFVNHHQSFLDELQHDPVQIEDVLQSSLDGLLSNVVCKTFEERLQSTTREQIVQILINLEYFESASVELEKKLAGERISDRRGKISLEATAAFAKARKKAEGRIFELLNSVVDNFLDLADYDWGTTELTDRPSSYLVDMAKFLKTMVNSSLVNLPRSIKSFVYFDAFDHLSSSLLQFLLDSGENITLASVANFDVDVKYLDQFVNELGADANDLSITTTVTELRQNVDLLLNGSIEDYVDPLIRMKKYDRVKPENAQALFAKISHAKQQEQLGSEGDSSTTTSNGRLSQLSIRESFSSASASLSPKLPSPSSSKLMKMYQKGVGKLNDRVN
ncbi:Sec15p [Sugiyamaella lignohabitans]|uniref:Exocyst complex component SEC15 n=1 Tax=Sugiyamaella lignohabitans TaxID=796027 RepID=A0A167DFY9_9ASCO|nr:Sec15p [Sugiyamaella lignohabitans]ANB12875.1 Sec15p [Sugiyamaella lignohabitans]